MKLTRHAIISFVSIRTRWGGIITHPTIARYDCGIDDIILADGDECVGIVPAPVGAVAVYDESDNIIGYEFRGADHPESVNQWEQSKQKKGGAE